MSDLEERIAAYLRHRMPDAGEVIVDEVGRIHGGSSQETFRLRARWTENGEAVDRRLILRREPPSGLVIAERDLEYTVYAALAGRGVPVPAVHFLELDASWLDRPFFIMDMVEGDPGHFWTSSDPYKGHDAAIGRQFWQHLGTLAAIDHRDAGLAGLRNGDATSGFWKCELDHYEAIIDAGEAGVEPTLRAAIRWLRRNPPPEPAKPAIVHGDYRAGNFLFTPDGRISAVLDWEMAHVGDPLEDIAWALNPAWPMTRHFPLEDGLAIWEDASGMTIDRTALDWWRLFAPVKACGLWTTAEASFADGKNREMVVALTGLRASHGHRKEILERMGAMRGA